MTVGIDGLETEPVVAETSERRQMEAIAMADITPARTHGRREDVLAIGGNPEYGLEEL